MDVRPKTVMIHGDNLLLGTKASVTKREPKRGDVPSRGGSSHQDFKEMQEFEIKTISRIKTEMLWYPSKIEYSPEKSCVQRHGYLEPRLSTSRASPITPRVPTRHVANHDAEFSDSIGLTYLPIQPQPNERAAPDDSN